MEIYKDSVTVLLEIKTTSKLLEEVELEISYQGCAMKGLCYPPQKRNLLVSRPYQGISETVVWRQKYFVLSGTFFLFGMLLAFTPCVLPMVPILSAVIIGLKDGN